MIVTYFYIYIVTKTLDWRRRSVVFPSSFVLNKVRKSKFYEKRIEKSLSVGEKKSVLKRVAAILLRFWSC